jgi:hypothetical protein
LEKTRQPVKTIRRKRESWLRVPQKPSAFIRTHNVCGGNQIVAELKEFPVRRTKTSPLPIR